MKKNFALNLTILVLLFSIIQVGCKKDIITNSDDFLGQLNSNRFFEIGSAYADIVNGKVFHDSTLTSPAIAIQLNGIPSNDMIVTGVIDTTLGMELNNYYKTNELIPQKGAFGFVHDTLTIHAGTINVLDSLYCRILNARLLDTSGTYLIPVRLSANKNEALVSNKVALYRMSYTQNNYYGQFSYGNSFVENNPSQYFPIKDIRNHKIFDININRINNHAFGDIVFSIAAGVSSPFKYSSLKVKAGLDFTDSIFSFFKQNIDTVSPVYNNRIMPSSNLRIETNDVVIDQGYYSSMDNFVYRLSNISSLSSDSNYLFYMNLPENSDTNYFPPDPNDLNTGIYVRVKCNDLLSLNIDSSNASILGKQIERSNWIVNTSTGNDSVYNASYYNNIPSFAIDGDPDTYWAPSSYSPSNSFYIDMKQPYLVKGFRILPNYYDITKDVLSAEILSSENGEKWTSQGYYFGSAIDPNSSIDNPDYKYIHFNNPVNAQYYQIRITSTSNIWGTPSIPEIVGFE